MVSESRVAKTPRQLRDEVEQLIRDDLIGPLGGAEEELHDRRWIATLCSGCSATAIRLRPPGRGVASKGVRQR